ncbi:MAG: hypothetical protein ISR97_01430 [Nitrospira sp.]|nr:hypothetical protein [Nitrospira sp.]
MEKPEFEQFGVTEEECNSICAKRDLIRNYTFGIASAVGILTGSIVGLYISNGLYEKVLFFLFFGCFLGSLFGAVFTIAVKMLYVLFLHISSPPYRSCKKYFSAKSKAQFVDYREYP